jgi:O-antigen/teichoic acid export membrane protein
MMLNAGMLPLSVGGDSGSGVLGALLCYAAANMQTQIAAIPLRALGHAGEIETISAVSRLAEIIAVCLLVRQGAGPTAAALGMLGVALVAFGGVALLSRYKGQSISAGGWPRTFGAASGLLLPSVSLLAFPLGNAMYWQGFNVAIGICFGEVALALVATHRMLLRPIALIAGVFYGVAMAETPFAAAAAEGRLREIHRTLTSLSLSFVMLGILVTVSVGPALYPLWVGNELRFDWAIFSVFCLSSVMSAIAMTSSGLLTGLNRHAYMGLFHLLASSIALISSIWLARSDVILCAIAPLVIVDLCAMVYAVPRAATMLGLTPMAFASGVVAGLARPVRTAMLLAGNVAGSPEPSEGRNTLSSSMPAEVK